MTGTGDRAAQLSLFGPPEETSVRRPHLKAVSAEHFELGRRLPENVHLGTSTWSFPGWAGILWAKEYSQRLLARQGLVAYSEHPLLTGAGIDRTYYQPLPAADFADYAAQVPEGFRFVTKAQDVLTWRTFPHHDRYGDQKGQANPRFLDAAYATDECVAPMVDGLGAQAGPLVFQFPPQDLGEPLVFIEQLFEFLEALPQGPLYAVEIRNREILSPQYALALADAGASHCFTVYPRMPDLKTQWEATVATALAPEGCLVLRWMLQPGLTYQSAGERYRPFHRLVDEDPGNRQTIASFVRHMHGRGRPAFVTVNNKAEGSAPLSVFKLAEAVVG